MSILFRDIRYKELKRDLMLRFTLLLSIFMILLSVAYIIFAMTISAKEHDNNLLNIAGRQRMYIYQYASEINQTLIGLATSDLAMALSEKKKVDLTEKEFEKVHDALINGGKILIRTGALAHLNGAVVEPVVENIIDITALKDDEILGELSNVFDEWQELKRISLLSLRTNSDSISSNRFVRRLLDQANKTVAEIDHVVELMRLDSQLKSNQLNTLLVMMVVVGALLFLMLIYYVYSKIVMPLDNIMSLQRLTMENLLVEKTKAEKANQAKSEFLSSMSHELRTPMNAILGFGQLLELDSEGFNELQRDNVNEILEAGHHLLSLINDVLDLAKIESGKLEMSMEKVHVDDLLSQCITLIGVQAKERQLELIDKISCRGYSVIADYTRLKQVILNLLSNAVKYNRDQGCITLSCEVAHEQRLRIHVTDTGDGLTDQEITKLFTSFERLNTVNNVEGTGIGLVITKHLIELMGGAIGVESTPSEGTTFWIEVKLA
ncbi:MAG: ATP-binding protein [Gammaproteobacteria bacterium]|nr:ATP-binding protein [Gammaproteobacteria bacterium]